VIGRSIERADRSCAIEVELITIQLTMQQLITFIAAPLDRWRTPRRVADPLPL
jgi:hypothetical protein